MQHVVDGTSVQEEIRKHSEEELIEQAVNGHYIRGLRLRDFDLIRTVCVPEARLMSVGADGVLRVTTLEQWSRRFDPAHPPFQNLDADILKIDRVGTAAQVKIRFVVDSTREVVDFLHMLKVDDRWRVVNITDF